jgi:hypothetical protein
VAADLCALGSTMSLSVKQRATLEKWATHTTTTPEDCARALKLDRSTNAEAIAFVRKVRGA